MTAAGDEHLKGCKERALQVVGSGNLNWAFASLTLDMLKHPETANHHAIDFGFELLVHGKLDSKEKMINFIEGLN